MPVCRNFTPTEHPVIVPLPAAQSPNLPRRKPCKVFAELVQPMEFADHSVVEMDLQTF